MSEEDDDNRHADQSEAVRKVFEHIFKDWGNIDASGSSKLKIYGMRSVVFARVMFPSMFDCASMRSMAKQLGVSCNAFSRNVDRLEKRIGADASYAFNQSKRSNR